MTPREFLGKELCRARVAAGFSSQQALADHLKFERTAVAKVIDPQLKSLVRIVLPDNTYAHIKWARAMTVDAAQMEQLYRRDLFFSIEYATTITQTSYEIGAFQDQLTAIREGATSNDVIKITTNS